MFTTKQFFAWSVLFVACFAACPKLASVSSAGSSSCALEADFPHGIDKGQDSSNNGSDNSSNSK